MTEEVMVPNKLSNLNLSSKRFKMIYLVEETFVIHFSHTT